MDYSTEELPAGFEDWKPARQEEWKQEEANRRGFDISRLNAEIEEMENRLGVDGHTPKNKRVYEPSVISGTTSRSAWRTPTITANWSPDYDWKNV